MFETLDDNALDEIISGLSDDDSDVRAQVLDTLTGLASKGAELAHLPTA